MPSKLSNVLTPKTKCQDILNLPKKKKKPKTQQPNVYKMFSSYRKAKFNFLNSNFFPNYKKMLLSFCRKYKHL